MTGIKHRGPDGKIQATHGYYNTPTYNSWRCMVARCHDQTHRSYKYYGAKGIYVRPSWRDSFAAFLADMGPRPEGFTLERHDSRGPYCEENCAWIPATDQGFNKRNTRFIKYRGELFSFSELRRLLKPVVSRVTFSYRLKAGWDPDQAAMAPVTPAREVIIAAHIARWGHEPGIRLQPR